MDFVWDRGGHVTVREVHGAVGSRRELASTTVITVMDRLWRKGLLRRRRDGRAHLYEARVTREDHAAQLVRKVLAGAKDRHSVLLGFVRSVDESTSRSWKASCMKPDERDAPPVGDEGRPRRRDAPGLPRPAPPGPGAAGLPRDTTVALLVRASLAAGDQRSVHGAPPGDAHSRARDRRFPSQGHRDLRRRGHPAPRPSAGTLAVDPRRAAPSRVRGARLGRIGAWSGARSGRTPAPGGRRGPGAGRTRSS